MKINISFWAIMLILSIILFSDVSLLAVLLAAVFHELGHLISARMRKVRIDCVNIDIMGARIALAEGIYSYTDEIIVCLCGPLVNLISGIVMLLLTDMNASSAVFTAASFSLCIVNLLPIKSFDGGRILHCVLSYCLDCDIADNILSVSSFIFLFVIWCFSVFMLLRCAQSLSLFIFSIYMFKSIFITD